MYNIKSPDIETRFLPDQNWQQHSFKNSDTEHHIAYSSMVSENNTKNLVIMPGLSEFSEKYIETARFFFEKGYNVYVLDWAYQGRSTRFENNRHKRHSDGYDSDLSDLHFFILTYIGKQKPLYAIGHSMGAHLAMRYLSEYDHFIKAAALTAPMLKIKNLKLGQKRTLLVAKLLAKFGQCYVPGGSDWGPKSRNLNNKDIFSNDPVRKKIHRQWSVADTQLRLGNPTMKWLKESLLSIAKLKDNYNKIDIPLLIALAGKEEIVDNSEIKCSIDQIPNAELIEYKNAKHEILMEIDAVRNNFLNKSIKLFN